jgi:type I restriction enzyme S subunit
MLVELLQAIDEKIELNRRMNETLEAIARALFQSWFVDFDPVRAKMEGRQPTGMDAETAALLPDSFEESELGEIPKGWQIRPLSKCVTYLSRGVAPTYVPSSPIQALNQKAIRWWSIDETVLKFHDPLKAVRTEAYICRHDVVVNSTGDGTIGRAYWFYHDVPNLFADSHVSIVRTSLDVLFPEVLTFLLETARYQDIISGYVTGTTGQLELNRSNLGSIPLVCAPIVLQQQFSRIVAPLFAGIWNNRQQSQTLASLRDTLLPELLSGEVRVREAERELETVL